MPAPVVLLHGLRNPVALRPRAGGSEIVVALRRGTLLLIDAVAGTSSVLAAAPGWIRTFDLSPDGQTAYVSGSTIGLWAVPLDGSAPTRLIRNRTTSRAVVVDVTGTSLHAVEGFGTGRVIERGLVPPTGSIRARGLQAARGMVVQQASGRILVAEAVAGGRLVDVQPTAPHVELAGGLGTPTDLAWSDASESRVVAADRTGRVLDIDATTPGSVPRELYSGLADVWAARPLDATRLVIGSGDSVLIADLSPIPLPPVEVMAPPGELFISGWVQVPVVVNDPALDFDDLDFAIEPQDGGALVSLSRDNGFDPAHPSVLLTAGWLTGTHELSVRNRADGSEVARAKFDVLDTWTDSDSGPSFATFGPVLGGPDSGTWGGPGAGDHLLPQNVKVHETLGVRNIGVVLVQMNATAQPNAQYPTGAALTAYTTMLRNELVNGVMVGGQLRSVADYYAQASNGRFAINLVGIAGPIELPNAWSTYFDFDAGTDAWKSKPGLDTTIIAQVVAANEAAAQAGGAPVLDLSAIDTIVYIVKSRIAAPDPDLFVWPRASLAKWNQIIGTQPVPFPFGTLNIPVSRDIARVFMPDDWAARGSGRRMHETLAHEIGHNFGILDQYNQGYSAAVADRVTGSPLPVAAAPNPTNPTGSSAGTWEIMSWEQNLPLPSAAHRLMLGWIEPAEVKLYNFGVMGRADDLIDLHAAGSGTTPAGRFAAIEVRIEDGKNYYLEYRPSVAGRIVDNSVPEGRAVVLTEALTRLPAPTDRAQILLASDDVADAIVERGSFVVGQDYRERDTTTPGFEQEFIVDVVSTAADFARVRIRYAADTKPDPSITPWSPSSNWQSPDLEVVNDRNRVDASFRNVPWEGHANEIRARVSNRGTSDAHSVKVGFFAKDFTLGGGTEVPLGSVTADIAAGGSVNFVAPQSWVPKQVKFPFGSLQYPQHSCIVARVAPFLDPIDNIFEVTPENNEAQSNYTWLASSTASPASREVTTILAENPLDEPAIVEISVRQPHPLFRVYVDHRWVRLNPGEQRRILVMVESLLGDETYTAVTRKFAEHERRIETDVRLSAYADTGVNCAPSLIGGAALRAMTGAGTTFEQFEAFDTHAFGVIVEEASGNGIDGPVLISVRSLDPDDPEPERSFEATARDGLFRLEIDAREGRSLVQAHYLGLGRWMPADSDELRV